MTIDVDVRVMVDASAAVGITSRRGIGKAICFDTHHLWIQEVSAKMGMQFEKAKGANNPQT